MKKRDPKDQPYVENYPVLYEWLKAIDARPDVQFLVGEKPAPRAIIEKWICRGGSFFVLTHEKGRGWDIFTSVDSIGAEESLIDAEKRLRLKVPRDGERLSKLLGLRK